MEIFVKSILIIGWIIVIYFILRDPILLSKKILRGLKFDNNLLYQIIFSPIWGTVWIIDKAFNLKIYINYFEEASIPKPINFNEYDKYLSIKTENLVEIEAVIKSYLNKFYSDDDTFNLNQAEIAIGKFKDKIILKFTRKVSFASINLLVEYISSQPTNKIFVVKGIFFNRQNRKNSYYIFYDSAYSGKLIGKTFSNKKMYINLFTEEETIFFNSNIDYLKSFSFNRFENKLSKTRFKTIKKHT